MSKSGSSAKHFPFLFMTMENEKLKSTKQLTIFERHIIGYNTYKFNIYTRGGIDDTKENWLHTTSISSYLP